MLDIPKTILYEEIHKGLINVTSYRGAMRISFREMREYGATNGVEYWHLPDGGEYGFIGLAFRNIAQKKNSLYCHDIHTFYRNHRGFDGAVYIAPSAYINAKPGLLEFVCRGLFRYNQLVIRRRPFSKRRFLFLCFTDNKTKKRAETIRERLEERYPGIVRLESLEYVRQVSSRSI